MAQADVNWDEIDKGKFFYYGVGAFSAVTTMLFPLTVVKTRQMASHDVGGGFAGAKQTASNIWRTEGVPGFYRGFSTIIFGTIPARAIYLTSLEMAKSMVYKLGHKMDLSDTTLAGLSNFAGGASASLSTQLVTVPIDVVSQRQMVHGQHITGHKTSPAAAAAGAAGTSSSGAAASATAARPGPDGASMQAAASGSTSAHGQAAGGGGPGGARSISSAAASCSHRSSLAPSQPVASTSLGSATPHSHRGMAVAAAADSGAAPKRLGGLQVAKLIIKEEGVKGLYRGFSVSVATFVPNSAVWWGAYGVYKQALWDLYSKTFNGSSSGASASGSQEAGASGSPATSELVAVQTASSMLAGATSSFLTNPLDLIKTRIQIARKQEGQIPTFRSVLDEILAEEGPRGLLRGVLPRMANAALWGTCMVTVYETLKRVSRKQE